METKMEIIFEDKDIFVLNKPAGMVVNRAVSAKGETLQDWVGEYLGKENEYRASEFSMGAKSGGENWRSLVPENFSANYGEPEEIFSQREGMVHRLDKNTSGVIVFAKNPGSLVNLLTQFRQRKTQKKYLCLVHGKPHLDEATVSAPLGRSQKNRKKFAVNISGREAVTKYKVIERFDSVFKKDNLALFEKYLIDVESKKALRKNLNLYQAGFSLVACWPKTGRTHQIRVHMAHIQHPLVGDVTYVGRKRASIDPIWCERQFLHASTLELTHPRTGEKMIFEASLSDDLERVLGLVRGVV